MNPNVDDILTWLLRIEDRSLEGKTLDEGDGVGLTRFGINQKWDSSKVPSDFFTLPPAMALIYAKQFYREQFWDKLNLDTIPMPLAASVLSCAVNCGVAFARISLIDAQDFPENEWLDEFIAYWKAHYAALVTSHPTLRKFSVGWTNRANAIYPNLP